MIKPTTARSRVARARKSRRGITLIELMVSLTIVMMMLGGAAYGFGLVTRTNLRSACMKIAGAARFGYHRAITRSATVRLVLDFEQNTMKLEEATGRVTLVRNMDERRRAVEEETGHSAASVDPWEAARASLEKANKPSFGASPFGPITGDEGQELKRYQAQSLGDGIRLVKVLVPHEIEPVDHGKVEIYFFPGGRTEQAVIQLTDTQGSIYSVIIHPLTGTAEVKDGAVELELLGEDASDTERSEVRDPG